jgi:hypothetical protein
VVVVVVGVCHVKEFESPCLQKLENVGHSAAVNGDGRSFPEYQVSQVIGMIAELLDVQHGKLLCG